MTFICQIALPEELFGVVDTKMAYLFMSDYYDEHNNKTWDSNSGENAVILQPGGDNCESMNCEIGPSIEVWKEMPGERLRTPFPCKFAVTLSEASPDETIFDSDQDFENKIGGYPNFLQNEEFPEGEKKDWRLLLQLDSCDVPFEINFGDAGVGYAFISRDGKIGRFLWQCC